MLERFGPRFAILALAATLLAACASAPPRERVYVRMAPPPPPVEVVTVQPGPGYVWVPGYYRWNGAGYYVWVRGRWVASNRAWVPGHWGHDRYGWYWVEGHWR